MILITLTLYLLFFLIQKANQSGLGTIHSSESIISNKSNYQIKQDKLSQENSVFIRDLPPITSDFIRPVGIPSSWQKENQLEPSSWNKAQVNYVFFLYVLIYTFIIRIFRNIVGNYLEK